MIASEKAISAARGDVRRLSRELREARVLLRDLQDKGKKRQPRALSDGLNRWKAERDECDKLLGRIVKVEVGRCQSCGIADRTRLQWAHGFSRRYLSTRWERRNSFCLCSGCHVSFTHDPISWERFMRLALGDREYEGLRLRSRLKTSHNVDMILFALRVQAEELGVMTDEGWKAWQSGV